MMTVILLIYLFIMFFIIFFTIFLTFFLILRYNRRLKDKKNKKHERTLERYEANPVIAPISYRKWEDMGTFNPAAIKDDEGFVHLLYRAVGSDGVSTIGHAKSQTEDGLKFNNRTAYPIFVSRPTSFKEDNKNSLGNALQIYSPHMYASGGSWGGAEDPRAVVIDGRVYMTYTSFDGWESVRIAATSISMEDLKQERWNWKQPRFISPPGEINKNWVLFPEKINGKFAVLHSVSPEIKIAYLDNLNIQDNNYIESSAPSGGREGSWDNWMRGAGSPPIKTVLGWLVLYHAMDKNDPNKYKLGCMVLDLKNPTKILYRSPTPIMEPEKVYENDWKPGVVYASGALIIKDDLVVYYGGGDKYVCVAKTPLKPLLAWLVNYGLPAEAGKV